MSNSSQIPDSISLRPLSIATLSPNADYRDAVIKALGQFQNGRIREYISYPPDAGAVAQALKQDFDVVIIDLDSDPECALGLVESVCVDGSTNVIVYSAKPDPDLLLRCMRAGAREFLPLPISPAMMTEALMRVSARRLEMPTQKTTKRDRTSLARGKLLLFMSGKGGAGVTTLACSLGVSLAQEFGQRTLLIDLTLPLGDAALNLGLRSTYSTVNALENFHRLDASLLSNLLVQHPSGLYVLAAPSEMTTSRFNNDAVFKLLRIACQEFDYVVVDGGSRLEVQDAYMIDETATIYLVTQIGISELRNSNRLIKQLLVEGGPKLEVVVNRFDSGSNEIDEAQIRSALTLPIQWKIPNDYAAVRRMQNLGSPINGKDSDIARAIRQMGESVCGLALAPKKKRRLRFFKQW